VLQHTASWVLGAGLPCWERVWPVAMMLIMRVSTPPHVPPFMPYGKFCQVVSMAVVPVVDVEGVIMVIATTP
jgi:hypothetical protein